MIIYSLSSTKNGVSIASRVVPSTLDTITRSSFKMELTKLDFPTLGRPMQQNEVIPSYGAISFFWKFFHHDIQQVAKSNAMCPTNRNWISKT